MRYRNRNDAYFHKNLKRLIMRHGGKWIVISDGHPVGIGPKKSVKRYLDLALRKRPRDIPLISPIPTREQIHCILSSFLTKR